MVPVLKFEFQDAWLNNILNLAANIIIRKRMKPAFSSATGHWQLILTMRDRAVEGWAVRFSQISM
jgi:hypothetical protein